MKEVFSILLCILFGIAVSAQKQNGFVRTPGSANKKGDVIQGVILRPIGGNDVKSDADGQFSMLLQQRLEEGDYFLLAKLFKKGYEPIDKNILKRKFIYSKTVPIEIVLISSKQLVKIKEDIEEKARKNTESRCRKKKTELERQLAKQQITKTEYQKQIIELERHKQAFEKLIAAMADHYARTDFNKLDSLNAVINECIINGELEKADSLINTKGDVRVRANENIAKGRRLRAAEEVLDSI